MLIGYARVSTADQTLALQQDALQKAGCGKIFTDTISGATTERRGLEQALDFAREGDTLVVWRLDRLGRSLKHLIETITALNDRNVGFKSLTENIDTTTSGGKLIFHIFGALAEFERDIIKERTLAGLQAARARGRLGGRPKALNDKKAAMAQQLHKDKTNTIADICKMLNISRATLYRYIQATPSATHVSEDSVLSSSPAPRQEPAVLPTRAMLGKAGDLEDKLTAREKQALRLAKYHHHLTVGLRAKQDLEKTYRYWCMENKLPFVRIRKLRHFAEVSLEFETMGHEPNPETCEKAKEILQQHSWAPYTYHWTSRIWSTSRVKLELAETLAETLFAIATT